MQKKKPKASESFQEFKFSEQPLFQSYLTAKD